VRAWNLAPAAAHLVDSRLRITPEAKILEWRVFWWPRQRRMRTRTARWRGKAPEIVVLPTRSNKVTCWIWRSFSPAGGINELLVEAGLNLKFALAAPEWWTSWLIYLLAYARRRARAC